MTFNYDEIMLMIIDKKAISCSMHILEKNTFNFLR